MATNSGGSLSCQLKAGIAAERITLSKVTILCWFFFLIHQNQISLYILLHIRQTRVEIENVHKVYVRRATPPKKKKKQKTVALMLIYVWAECPGYFYCQDDLEELENEVEQM